MPGFSLRAPFSPAALTAALAAAAPAAQAQDGRYYTAPPPPARDGWNVGFGLGGGDLSCEGRGCDGVTEAGSFDVQVGSMLRPRLRVLGELWVMGHTEDNLTISQAILTGGLQYWIIERLWVRGGIGVASASARYDGAFVDLEDQTENVFAVAGGVGFEVVSRPTFAFDIQIRGGTGFYDDVKARNAALVLGLTWY